MPGMYPKITPAELNASTTPEDLIEIAEAYAYAYNASDDDKVLNNMRALADHIDEVPEDVLYWYRVCALLEDLDEDRDGMRAYDYVETPEMLSGLLMLDDCKIDTRPAALAYARARFMLAYNDHFFSYGVDFSNINSYAISLEKREWESLGEMEWSVIERIADGFDAVMRNFQQC